MKIETILVKPVLTEKATNLVSMNYYSFIVNLKANKSQIKEVLEKLYKVKVDSIKISLRKGKVRKVGKKMVKKKLSDIKIAYIKLKSGKIDIFPQA